MCRLVANRHAVTAAIFLVALAAAQQQHCADTASLLQTYGARRTEAEGEVMEHLHTELLQVPTEARQPDAAVGLNVPAQEVEHLHTELLQVPPEVRQQDEVGSELAIVPAQKVEAVAASPESQQEAAKASSEAAVSDPAIEIEIDPASAALIQDGADSWSSASAGDRFEAVSEFLFAIGSGSLVVAILGLCLHEAYKENMFGSKAAVLSPPTAAAGSGGSARDGKVPARPPSGGAAGDESSSGVTHSSSSSNGSSSRSSSSESGGAGPSDRVPAAPVVKVNPAVTPINFKGSGGAPGFDEVKAVAAAVRTAGRSSLANSADSCGSSQGTPRKSVKFAIPALKITNKNAQAPLPSPRGPPSAAQNPEEPLKHRRSSGGEDETADAANNSGNSTPR